MSKLIVLASHNLGKVREYQEILSPFGYEIKSVAAFGHHEEPSEDGETYHENAYIKAKYYFDVMGMPVIADDSGIEIEALGTAFPGIFSARFREQIQKEYNDKGPEMVNDHIIEKIKDNPNRAACFHCSICLIEDRSSEPRYFDGVCPGHILYEVKGNNGFGYDPIFQADEGGIIFGTASEEEKNSVSHRGKALAKLIEYLENKGK